MKWKLSIYLICLAISVLFVACNTMDKTNLSEIKVKWNDGMERSAITPGDTTIKVFIFMSPECPLCINYTQTISFLADTFSNSNVSFYTVFPGNFYSEEEIKNFLRKYELNFSALFDSKNEIAKKLKATVTPEAFLLNSKGEVVYSGAIDNLAYAPGQKRITITEFYLRDAIAATLAGQKTNPDLTDAIGCYIEY